MAVKKIECWRELTLANLFISFRKAKADCFFERSICNASEFVEYEQELASRLMVMLNQLHAGKIKHLLLQNLGETRIASKKLGITKTPQKGQDGHGFFSDPALAFERLLSTHDLTPEFRLVGDFPIEMHVLSALWINHVGHKFDAALSNSAFGSRLRRYRPDPSAPKDSVGNYHLEAVGSFRPYFSPYKEWRSRGMQAIRKELEADHAVIAISMDLTSYYHRVDPAFISDDRFLDEAGIKLTPWELEFTEAFSIALSEWSKKIAAELHKLGCVKSQVVVGGLPIGLSLSRVVANTLLAGLDRDIEQGLTPVYYGRYVDDMFLVLRDPGNLQSTEALLDFIAARTQTFPASKKIKKGKIYLTLPGNFQGKTKLLLQQSKQKAFFLQGQGGLDLLSNIESQIHSVSSERRLMPSPDSLESMASAKVLTAAGNSSEEADTLHRADGLSVRRLGWSIQLRAVETLARDLRKDDWKKEREQFYEFAHNHILRPDKILDHLDYLHRLLSLAVALTDWTEAQRLIDSTTSSLDKLQAKTAHGLIKVNGFEAKKNIDSIWSGLKNTTLNLAKDAVVRSIHWDSSTGQMRPLSEDALAVCELVKLGRDVNVISALALALRESDWAKIAYKDHLRRYALRERPTIADEQHLHCLYTHEGDLRVFLIESTKSSKGRGASRVLPRCIASGEDDIAVASRMIA